jgi:hypothetical protein
MSSSHSNASPWRFRPRLEEFESRDVPSSFGTNLIVNGDGEAGAGSATGADVISVIPGWTPSGNFTVVDYGAGSAGAFPTAHDPGPGDRGQHFFAGGPGNATSRAKQVITLTSGLGAIDHRRVQYMLSGYLGGSGTHGGTVVVKATFRGATGQVLGKAMIGPVSAADRHDTTGLFLRASSRRLPPGTRSITITVIMTGTDPSYNDGYADDLSLILTRV